MKLPMMTSGQEGRQLHDTLKKKSMVALTMLALALCANGVSPVYASTFSVSNLNDSGAGFLRQAIADANAAPGVDTITFIVPGPVCDGSIGH
jgi:hypothetical protein